MNAILEAAVTKFVIKVNKEIEDYYQKNYPSLSIELIEIKENKRYTKLIQNGSVWGFISKYDGEFKGSRVKVGDLLKAASWSSPAKHSRGNIINGTASYNTYGPSYLT